VVTEYNYHDSDRFVIEVDYFSEDELVQQFEELLQGYQEHGRVSQRTSAQDRQELERRARLAEDTFTAAFGERDTQNLLLASEDAISNRMRRRISSGLQRFSTEGIQSFNRIEPCSERLGQLTSQNATGAQGAVWPYIRKIKWDYSSNWKPQSFANI